MNRIDLLVEPLNILIRMAIREQQSAFRRNVLEILDNLEREYSYDPPQGYDIIVESLEDVLHDPANTWYETLSEAIRQLDEIDSEQDETTKRMYDQYYPALEDLLSMFDESSILTSTGTNIDQIIDHLLIARELIEDSY